MARDFLDLRDELTIAISFVECAFMACNKLSKEHANPLCAVLDAASTKLREVDAALSTMTDKPQPQGNNLTSGL